MATAEHPSRQSPRRFYRDPEHRVIAGVCAGVADYFGFRRCAVRWITVIAFFFFMPAVLITYIAIAVLVPVKPRKLYRSENEEEFWRSVRTAPKTTLADVRHKYREVEARVQRMERYVTSRRFDLDREFRDLQDEE